MLYMIFFILQIVLFKYQICKILFNLHKNIFFTFVVVAIELERITGGYNLYRVN